MPGSAIERRAEERISEHLDQRVGSGAAAQPARSLDFEPTIDLALTTLDEIAADARSEGA
jgi:hypothetical protein